MKVCLFHSLVLYCLCSGMFAQTPQDNFLKEFNRADSYQKVKLVAASRFAEIKPVYPLIKDTLEKIRRRVYMTPQPNSIKVAFDKIDMEMALQENKYAKAIIILENSLRRHAAEINDSLKCWIELKKLFMRIRNYNKALEIHRILELKWNRRTDTLFGMGLSKSSIYHRMGLIELAICERRSEYDNSGLRKDTLKTAGFYNDMGVYFNTLKNSDSAEVYLLKARGLLTQKKYPPSREVAISFFKGLVEGNLGLSYYNRGNYKEAIPLLKTDIYYSLKSSNFESALNSYLLMVQSALKLKKTGLARAYLDSAARIANRDVKEIAPRLKYLLTCADYYDSVGDYYNANKNYRNYLELNEKASNLENEQMLRNENVSIDVERKEIETAERESALRELQLEEAKQKSATAWLLMGILVLSGIIIFLIVNNRSTKKREEQLALKNEQISSQKAQIEQSLHEKEILIKEIHHRVKNNLQIITSMLSLQIGKVEDEKTENILRDAKQRISSIALTHQMLYQKENLVNISLDEYIERLVRQIEFTMPVTNVELVTDINIKKSRLNIDNAVPLGLLLNELLTNAYKHAFPEGVKGRITVSLLEDGRHFILTVSDNGIGLPENFNSSERKTLGLELVYILADQLDSDVSVETAVGSAFTIKLQKHNHS